MDARIVDEVASVVIMLAGGKCFLTGQLGESGRGRVVPVEEGTLVETYICYLGFVAGE